jgi:hypothetical protein
MSIGISVPLPAYLVDMGAMARTAEELGFDSFGWLREETELLGGDFDHR